MKKTLLIVILIAFSFSSFSQDQYINGNLAVGTSSRTDIGTLHVTSSDTSILPVIRIESETNSDLSFIRFQAKNSSSVNKYSDILFDPDTGNLAFKTPYNSAEKMTITTSGNIGIGTTNPSQKLDVEGLVESKGIVLIDSNLGSNTDYTALFREDNGVDNAVVKLRIGDDQLGSLNIGYKYWSTGEWVSTFFVNNYGQVGIGTTDTKGFKLGVNGKIAATEVKVATYANWPDYVFKDTYNLPALKKVERHIKEKGHLKDIPNAEEVKKDGFYLAEMNAKLLQKIEELTLYTIEQEKRLEELASNNTEQQKEIEAQNTKIERLEKENATLQSLCKRLTAIEALLSNQKQ